VAPEALVAVLVASEGLVDWVEQEPSADQAVSVEPAALGVWEALAEWVVLLIHCLERSVEMESQALHLSQMRVNTNSSLQPPVARMLAVVSLVASDREQDLVGGLAASEALADWEAASED
jgi:hypothetical protein